MHANDQLDAANIRLQLKAKADELNQAIRSGNVDAVKRQLLRAGKDDFINLRLETNSPLRESALRLTPLRVALEEAKDNKPAIVKLLLENGAKVKDALLTGETVTELKQTIPGVENVAGLLEEYMERQANATHVRR